MNKIMEYIKKFENEEYANVILWVGKNMIY
jgi:hypothetical protein